LETTTKTGKGDDSSDDVELQNGIGAEKAKEVVITILPYGSFSSTVPTGMQFHNFLRKKLTRYNISEDE